MTIRPRILIVEDDPQVRSALSELLTADGFETEIAENGAEAIDRLQTGQPPAAIVVDLIMPGIVGQELLEYLHGEARFAQVPVAVFTASPQLASPAYPVFKKPMELDLLRTFLRGACASSAA